MTPLAALRLLVAGVALACSLAALAIFLSDLYWAQRDRRATIRVTARALPAREALRLAQVVLLTLSTLAVIQRDTSIVPQEWQMLINASQTLTLGLMAVTTLFELYTRQQVQNMPTEEQGET